MRSDSAPRSPGSDGLCAQILDSISDGVYAVDRERRITYWSRAAERITGFRAQDLLGKRCFDNILAHVDDDGLPLCSSTRCPLARSMGDGLSRTHTIYFHHRDGHRVPVRSRTMASREEASAAVTGGVEVFADISRQRADANRIRELEELAYLDELTRLPNRRYVEQALQTRLGELQRAGRRFAVAMLDADHFKAVNDRWGHEAGDRVLQAMAKTLRNTARSTDVVGRWGGEEFVVLMSIREASEVQLACDRLRALVASAAVPTGDRHIRVTVSVGATEARPGDSAADLLARADELMYAAKAAGRDRVVVDTE